MGEYIDLLRLLPRTSRDVDARRAARTPEAVAVARRYGQEYFDGDRAHGYGGYHDDGRWRPVAGDILRHYFGAAPLRAVRGAPKVLDVGCAKGFLVRELVALGADAYGLDISPYAIRCAPIEVAGRLHVGSADSLPFPDGTFDLVISINTLHNLPRERLAVALREIVRVSRGSMFVQVDSYRTAAERAAFLDWVLTAEWHGWPEEWEALFAEAGYDGDYCWTIMDAVTDEVSDAGMGIMGTRRGELDEESCAAWGRIPADHRDACLARLAARIPAETRAIFRGQRRRGLSIGSGIVGFHFHGGMHVRNLLRVVLPDDQLPPIVGPAGGYSLGAAVRNWDGFYIGALEALADREIAAGM